MRKVEYLVKEKKDKNIKSNNLSFHNWREFSLFLSQDFIVILTSEGEELISTDVLRANAQQARAYGAYILSKYRN